MDISLTINGKPFKVNASTVPIDTSLNTFIRENARLTGTKFMCLEGGCGVCLVALKGTHPVTGETRIWAVNSCLAPVFACHGLDVITVEGIGNRQTGFHPTQDRLYECSGSQCGYCSSGMIVNMYSLLESAEGGQISAAEVENAFGGNICRCTGYRPILDAFKAFASGGEEATNATTARPRACNRSCSTSSSIDMIDDIEDLGKMCTLSAESSASCGAQRGRGGVLVLSFDEDRQWHRVTSVEQIFDIFAKSGTKPYQLVAGNTAHGVYRRAANLQLFIDVNGVPELRTHALDAETGLRIGANVNLTETMAILRQSAATPGFEYCERLRTHIDLIANVPVRNAGTIAGNLCIKNAHNEFPSDLFLVLEAVGALADIRYSDGNTVRMTLAQFVRMDMHKKVLMAVTLPKLDGDRFAYRSYKIMPRAQNAHAYVNGAFLVETVDGKIRTIRICFGGIDPQFVHATATEAALVGRVLHAEETLKLAVRSLGGELRPDWELPDADPVYRKNLAISLFYKFVLSTADAAGLAPELRSGGEVLQRSLSSGVQSFDTFKERYPVTEPVLKLEGLMQVSGAALYANDLPELKDQLWAAFVPAGRPHVTIGQIDASEAMKMAGVHAFYTAKDIPGVNNFAFAMTAFMVGPEEIFVGPHSEVQFYGQPIGVIVAETMALANYAATRVKVTYIEPPNNDTDNDVGLLHTARKLLAPFGVETSTPSQRRRPVIPTLNDVLAQNAVDRLRPLERSLRANAIGVNGTRTVHGHLDFGSQYHYTMETQTTICVPNVEDELDVYSSTQWPDFVHCGIAACLAMPENRINVIVRRLGGAYGAKITRSAQVACACALAAHLTGRPVRFVLTIESNMMTVGKRYALACDYDIDVDDDGRIQRLRNDFVQDYGCSPNEPVPWFTLGAFANCYAKDKFTVNLQQALTDSPSHTFCRSPGTTEGIAMIEYMMEHIAFVTGLDPIAVRMANLTPDSEIHKLMPEFVADVEFEERRRAADAFNAANRWRKRGIAIVPMQFPLEYFGGFSVFVAIYHMDGTVAVSHSGVECGQGINTKVAQVVAFSLGIPLEAVRVKTLTNLVAANGFITGGSVTSEMVCLAATRACAELLERMRPVRETLPATATWAELANACNEKQLDLTAKNFCGMADVKSYSIWGLCCADVELDVLTGNVLLRRVDILEDTGESLSPTVDVGQVEGAFVMGIGYWLTESLQYDRNNGELLTNRTWTYKPPGAKDIPVDFRVRFMRNHPNPVGVLRSKATGEPAFCMAVVIIFALRYALNAARKDAGIAPGEWYHLGSASTPDVIYAAAGTNPESFTL